MLSESGLHFPDILIAGELGMAKLVLQAGNKDIRFKPNYSSAAKGDLFFLPGSLRLMEIAVREGSASEHLDLKAGDQIRITVKRKKQWNI